MGTKRPLQRERRRALLGGVGLIGAAIGALASPRRTAARDDDDGGVIGAWLVRGGRSGGAAYMLCFLPGGILQFFGRPAVSTTSPDDDPEAIEHRSDSIGQWVRTGFDEYTFTAIRAKYSPRASGLETISGTVRYDSLADTIEVTSLETVHRNLAGEVTATLPGAISQGTRVTVQSQP